MSHGLRPYSGSAANVRFPISTFLKRKGGLFKKAYELSVLCDVDVAVVIFGNNKKLHQFSSRDMREMLHRWTLVCASLAPAPSSCG